jgi:hypothetical protein
VLRRDGAGRWDGGCGATEEGDGLGGYGGDLEMGSHARELVKKGMAAGCGLGVGGARPRERDGGGCGLEGGGARRG